MKDFPTEIIEAFNDSLETCNTHPGFLDRFYEIFLASSTEVADKFKNTDFKQQQRFLKLSLYMMLMAALHKEEGNVHLQRIAERHSSRDLDIKPELYKLWLESLIQAAKEFDPAFNEQTDEAWRSIMQTGIDFMISQY